MIPPIGDRGFLPAGVHTCTADEFLARFMPDGPRSLFREPVLNIINYAASKHAESILVGGSFISDKAQPSDFDCVILFNSEKQIPAVRDSLDIESKHIDIFFASKDHPNIVKSFLRLFSEHQFGERIGVIEIILYANGKSHWDVTWEPDEDTFEIVKRVYLGRHYVDSIKRERVLVTVHGIRSHSEWDAEVTLIASANGWIVAPFRYGYVQPTVFSSQSYRDEIIDKFRIFLSEVKTLTDVHDVSVIAHSFGSYIAMSYALGFDYPPTRFDTLILTGSILNENFDFSKLNGKVGHIINEVAPNDEWAEWAQVVNFGRDPLLGRSATQGFTSQEDRLTEYKSNIFRHNNVIARDIMIQRWLPAMEANLGSVYRDSNSNLIRRFLDKI